MKTGPVTIEEVVEVFRALGGEATRADFLKKLSAGRGHSYKPYASATYLETTAWQAVQRRCAGYKKYTGPEPLFEEAGHGKCRLLNFDRTNSASTEAGPSELNDWEEKVYRSRIINETARNQALVAKLKKIYSSRCQRCGIQLTLPSGEAYAEAHHVRGLGDEGPDTLSNMLCLCANCHVLLDLKAVRIDRRSLRIHRSHELEQRFFDHHNELFNERWPRANTEGDFDR